MVELEGHYTPDSFERVLSAAEPPFEMRSLYRSSKVLEDNLLKYRKSAQNWYHTDLDAESMQIVLIASIRKAH
jgi:hypothetical protein